MCDHEDDYSPFVEDDETFGTYINRMKKVGVIWMKQGSVRTDVLLVSRPKPFIKG